MWGVVAASVLPLPAAGQELTYSPASSYGSYYDFLRAIRANPDRIAAIDSTFGFTRGPATFTFPSGTVYELRPIGERVVGYVIVGPGSLRYSPVDLIERDQLARVFEGAVEHRLESAVILFGDSTLTEFERYLTFAPAGINQDLSGKIRRTMEHLGERDRREFDPDILRTFLNGGSNDLFYAHLDLKSGRDLMVEINPFMTEASLLFRAGEDKTRDLISQSYSSVSSRQETGDRTGEASISNYDIEVWIDRSASGNLDFNARSDVSLVAGEQIGHWIPLWLHSSLEIDSVVWAGGERGRLFKEEDATLMWLRTNELLSAGDTIEFSMFYGGELIERFGDLFFIQSSSAWYPRTLAGRNKATFDIVYHTPTSYEFASAGTLVDTNDEGDVWTSHWRSTEPIRNVGFNIGIFEAFEPEDGEGPPVTVLYADAAHRSFRGVIPQGRNMKQQVGADVTNALGFYGRVFGPTGLNHFYATEIPFSHGEAFPGLVHLSLSTFLTTSGDGFDEWFRAHEVAHQWWGIGLDFDSYRDQWLSEGFASFAGLWYVQTVRGENDRYFDMLRDWRGDIMDTRGDPQDPEEGWAPIAMGYRTAIGGDPGSYNTIVYQKGAWVVHMIRTMMLNLRTMDEAPFTAMMQDFYQSYRGGNASTADFQTVVERHIGMPMGWFFEQWVRGNYIPKYKVSWTAEPNGEGKFRLRLRVRQEEVPPDFRSFVTLAVDFGGNRQARLRVEVNGADSEVPMPLMPLEPVDVKFNELESVLGEVEYERWRN